LTQKYGLTAATTDLIEPVTISEVRQYTRISDPDDDLWIKGAITAARLMVEKTTHRQLTTKTWNLTLDCFPSATASIPLPRPPLQTVDSISYVTSTGGSTTIDSTSILTDTASEPGRVAPVFNSYWPTARSQNAAVTIQYTAGYGSEAASVPNPLRQAILHLVGHWYENRETVLVGTVSKPLEMTFDALCGAYRFGGLH
jgi:uncharacterized phiE125 gp8 family phage protein